MGLARDARRQGGLGGTARGCLTGTRRKDSQRRPLDASRIERGYAEWGGSPEIRAAGAAGHCPARWPSVRDRARAAVLTAGATWSRDAVLLLDGVFLLRPELIDRWDLSILVSAAFEQTLDRARIRDLARLGSAAEVERRFRTRYIPAQKLYFATARPADHADIIVHNDEPRRPAWQVQPH
jgi:hypothetical protein